MNQDRLTEHREAVFSVVLFQNPCGTVTTKIKKVIQHLRLELAPILETATRCGTFPKSMWYRHHENQKK